jgi:hypothetical protein
LEFTEVFRVFDEETSSDDVYILAPAWDGLVEDKTGTMSA